MLWGFTWFLKKLLIKGKFYFVVLEKLFYFARINFALFLDFT